MLEVSLLGTGGMMPLPNRFLSSMILRLNGKMVLVDCGEGTQVSLKNLGWGCKNIDAIVFTHFHADHISGLPGMLLAIANSGREEKLKLIGPKGLIYVVEGLRRIAQDVPYEIEYIELDGENEALDVSGLVMKHLPVNHSVKCFAYSFELMRKGKFDVERAKALCLPRNLWGILQKQGTAEHEGKHYTQDMVLGPDRPGIKLGFCTDSRPTDKLPEFMEGCDLVILEGMYGEDDKLVKAKENRHMLFSEAATIAKEAGAEELWLTHYSPALTNPEMFLENATKIFPNTFLGYDNIEKNILFKEDISDK